MNIVVSAAALRTSGAKTIYLQFINHLKDLVGNNRYVVFVDESMAQSPIDGVDYVVVDLRSNIKRWKFDNGGCSRILKELNFFPDVVCSLQNTGVACLKSNPQVIYYHQSIPFYPHRWNPFKREERTMFFYKHIYPLFVKNSIGENTVMVAQIPFIKEGIMKRFKLPPERVHVFFPDVEDINVDKVRACKELEDGNIHFLFPSISAPYKEHKTLLLAMKRLAQKDDQTARRVRIHFTVSRQKSPVLEDWIEKLGVSEIIVFDGTLPHDQLLSMYKSANALLFPSTIETLGLPLIEAARFGLPIVAQDLNYAHEVLGKYEGATFVSPGDYERWADAILDLCKEDIRYTPLKPTPQSSWCQFFELIEKIGSLRKEDYSVLKEER